MNGDGRSARALPEDFDDVQVTELWKRYKTDGSREARERLTLHYQPLVKSVADRVAMSAPRHVDRADLASFGLFGLLDAIEKFDPGRGFTFETYAIVRIRGAILDEVRAIDWVPRVLRARARAVERAESDLGNRLLRSPSDDELIAELGISRVQLDHTKMLLSAGVGSVPVETMSTSVDPYQEFEARETLAVALKALSGRERLVLASYYFDYKTLAEIGATLGVTESRACQIHRKAIGRLRERLEREEAPLAVR